MTLVVKDCSPFDSKLSRDDSAWLGRLADASLRGLILRLEGDREDEPVVSCMPNGQWCAGRYVGSLTFEGRRLDVRPRFGADTLRAWCAGAFNLAMVDTPGRLVQHDWFVPWLLAMVWSQNFAAAARHGLAALRTDVLEHGLSIRGRLDVAETIRMRAAGTPGAASLRRDKSLDNPVSAAIVAAYSELSRWLGPKWKNEWLPERVQDLVPHLATAVGWRPPIPTQRDIDRVRLPPISTGFRSLARLSVQIVKQRGLQASGTDDGDSKGVMLDVAELWELYVLAVLRRAWPGLEIMHGTREAASQALLYNSQGMSLGWLKPDAVISVDGGTVAIVDAKYKRLHSTDWTPAPQREDLYQLAAYLGRFGAQGRPLTGVLVYPHDTENPSPSFAERGSPWRLDATRELLFVTLPHEIETAANLLRELVPLGSATH